MQTNQPKQDATIHLRVEAERKNRWVKLSQKAGQKLTDWVIDAVEESVATEAIDGREGAAGVTGAAVEATSARVCASSRLILSTNASDAIQHSYGSLHTN